MDNLKDMLQKQRRMNKQLKIELAMVKGERDRIRNELISATAAARMMLTAERMDEAAR